MLLALPLLAACPAKEFEKSKISLAELQVKKIANDWYPIWATKNVDKLCPATVLELAEVMAAGEHDTKDPWGTPFEITCGPNAPAGVKGLGAMSAGPDRKAGTGDDIKSW
jgi:hypothetical protein